jgi:hypothetical protein
VVFHWQEYWSPIRKRILKKNTHHPGFIIGLLSFILLLLGVVLRGNEVRFGQWLIIAALAFGGIHWIWSIIDVFTFKDFTPGSRIFWIVVVMLIPPVGGMLFYLMRTKNVSM